MEKVQKNLKPIDQEWNSLRRSWPFQRALYHVYDCKSDIEGLAIFNGVDFEDVKWNESTRGTLLLIEYRISHWKHLS